MILCSFRSSQLLHNASHQDEPALIFAHFVHTHLQLSVCGRQVGTANCSSAGYLPYVMSQAGVWVWQFRALLGYRRGVEEDALLYNHATLFNAHTRAYSSPCQLETGPPIKAFTIRSQNHGRNKSHVGILVERGIIRYFFPLLGRQCQGKYVHEKSLGRSCA